MVKNLTQKGYPKEDTQEEDKEEDKTVEYMW